jgi:hypothetical protein
MSPLPGGPDPSDGRERPTVVPAFDPEAFARDSEVRERVAPVVEGEPTIDQARRLHLEGEHEQALFLLTGLLELAPLHPEAGKLAAVCRDALELQCLSAIGSEAAVLVVGVSADELKTFTLDNVSGFILSLLDGSTDVGTVLDISGLPRLVALRHLRNLLERGLLALASGPRRR